MADIKISELPTATSVNDADIFVMDQGLVTKTATRAQILASIKDANNNITANAFFNNLASITASGTQVVLTVASAPVAVVFGSGGQVIKLPNATTLTNGTIFSFNNNQSSGAISVNNNSDTLVASVPSGGYATVVLLSNATAAGSWERHFQIPANTSWSTNTLDYPGSITSATWNGNAVAVNRGGTGATSAASALTSLGAQAALTSASPLALSQGGTGATTAAAALTALGAQSALTSAAPLAIASGGTGATSQAAALISLAAMATSERANYIPTTQLASLATTTQLAAITPNSIGAMATSERGNYATTTQLNAITAASLGALSTAQAVTIAQGGTGATAQQAALNAIAGAVTANQVLKGNGTNVVLGALTSADIPTLPIAKLSGVAASGANTDLTSVALTTGTVSTTPSGVTDIVNKSYADSIGSGINFHDACDYGTLAVLSPAATYNQPGGAGVGVNATLTGQTNAALQVDGVTVAVGKRVLVKNQTNAFQNGVYNVTQQGDGSTVPYILTRASDYDTSGSGTNEVQAGDFILILNSTLANTAWVQQTPAPIIFGTTNISFIQFAAAAAGVSSFNTSLTGLTPSSNTTGAVTLAGTLGVASGGTGVATLTGLVKGTGTTAMVAATAGTDYVVPSGSITGTASNVTGVVAIANGGSGQSTQAAAITALTGTQTSGRYLRSDGTNAALAAIQAGDVPTLNQNTSGTAAGLSSTLDVTSGGTGQTAYTDGQLLVGNTTTGGLSKATITAGSNVTVTNGNGTITIASTGGASGVSSFSAGTTGLTPNTATTGAVSLAGTLAVANGGTAATTAQSAISNLGVGMRMVEAQTTGNIVGTMNTGVSPNTFTVTATGVFTTDGYTPVLGDIIAFTLQTPLPQNGFWEVTTVGAVGVSAVFTRPSWFTGTVKNGMYMTRFGASQSAYVMALYNSTQNADIVVGASSINVTRVSYRTQNATTGSNSFTGRQIFFANSTTNAPFQFQTASALVTNPVAHYVEWDNAQMYVTNSAVERLPVATSKAQINAQTGTAYTLALVDAGYLVTLSNASAIALSVPTDASVAFPIGTQILLMQLGAGQVTVSAVTSGTTSVVGKNGLKTSGQYAVISLIKIAANSWVVGGDATV